MTISLSSPRCGGYSRSGAFFSLLFLLSSPRCGGYSYSSASWVSATRFLPRVAGVTPYILNRTDDTNVLSSPRCGGYSVLDDAKDQASDFLPRVAGVALYFYLHQERNTFTFFPA